MLRTSSSDDEHTAAFEHRLAMPRVAEHALAVGGGSFDST